MADILFTPSGKQLAQQQLDELLQELVEDGFELSGVHLALVWSDGVADNRRGPAGEVIWETSGPFGWLCVAVPSATAMPPVTREIDGLSVFVDAHATSATGTLLVDAIDGALSVEHRAT